jgi:ribosome biogenesis protein ENP2
MSNILVSEINGLKVYNLSAGRTLQEMLKNAKYNSKKLKKDEEYVNKIELIQDFEFSINSTCIKITDDGSHLFTSGMYPPRLKIFDLNEMSLKVERGIDAEVRRIATISNDYTKCALLLDDRNIEIHAQYGKHFSIRIPKFGRDMIYNKYSCDLMTCGSGNEVYRLNLCEGSFLKPFETDINGINSLKHNNYLDILGVVGEMGRTEIWDLKSHQKISGLPSKEDLILNKYSLSDLSSIEFDKYLMAIGNNDGQTKVYDLRFSNPLYTINHSYKFPIKAIKFHESSGNIITVDKKLAKFSNIKTGKTFTNIESTNEINEFESYEGSGMFFTANESPKMDIFYIPGLGPPPKWCSFLEKITEELEDEKTFNLYEDHKFLIMKDLEELMCTNLIGTNLLKSYMHGYFMDMKLYKKLRNLAKPIDYEKYLEDQNEKKINNIIGDRIVIRKSKNIKVNKEIANEEILKDNRFNQLFENEDYKIDINSQEYKKKKERSNRESKVEIKNESYEKDSNEVSERITNPELVKLNEKLIEQKKQKLSHLHTSNEDNDNFESKSNNIGDSVEIIQRKIIKERLKHERKNYKQEKKEELNNHLKGRRLLYPKKK